MVIMITGEINIGKTTIMDKIARTFKNDIIGIKTRELFSHNAREGFYISEFLSLDLPCTQNIIAKMDKNFKPIVFPQTFDNFGAKLLKNCLKSDKRIIIIDEIGVFESKSNSYLQNLYNLLDSDKIIIAVLKKRDHIFLNELKQKYNPLEITISNRDNIAKDIINKIKENL